ncbi:MAG: hypothetical protein ABI389_15690 [Rhodanobacter sp.]
MTTTVQMQGMAVPRQTTSRKVCAPAGTLDPRQVVDRGMGSDCKVSN